MSGEYQLRKDVDRLNIFFNEINRLLHENNISGIRELLEQYYDKSDVDFVRDKLSSDLNALNTDLNSLSVGLEHLSNELNDGYVTELRQLQESIYGGDGYTLNSPSASSLKGLLSTLQNGLNGLSDTLGDESNGLVKDINDLKHDNAQLSETLSALTLGLTSFSGTLNEFKAKLTQNNINYDDLDTGITSLLELIFTAQQDITAVDNKVDTVNTGLTTATGQISDLNNTIGSPTSTNNNTVFGKINNTNNLIDDVSEDTLNIEKTLYKGEGEDYNPNATPSNPTQGTVLPVLSQTKNDLTSTQHTVNNVQSKVNMFGDTLNELLTPVTNGGKVGLILVYYKDNSSSFNSNELLDLQNNYNININDINYALCTNLDPTQVKWYKKEDNVWSEDPNASALIHSEVTLMPLLGISYEITRTEMFPNPTNVCMNFKYVYVPAIRKYYKFIRV